MRIRDAVLERDGWRCADCGRGGVLEVHHVVHVEDGGTDALDNLVALCPPCHGDRHHVRTSPEAIREAVAEWRRFALDP